MKKIIILILINLAIILVGLNIINKKNVSNTFQTIAMAGIIPGIPDLPELPIPIPPIEPDGIVNEIVPQNVDPNHTPTADPIILLNIWLTSGYNLQPSNQYTVVGKSKTFYTDSGRSIWEGLLQPLATPHYVWYQSFDKKKWTKMSTTDKYLTVTPNEIGTVYYKQATVWYWKVPSLIDTVVYSNPAFITTFPVYHDADSLAVKADSNYLYNNQPDPVTTFVKGYPSPENSTGNIAWTIDNIKLATVDSQTGLVTANNEGRSGTVTVTGVMSNVGKPDVKNSTNIQIGGGLDDKKVDEGNKAEFNIQGHFDQKPTSVSWYRVSATGQNTTVDNISNNMSYSIPRTTYDDDNTKYYAVMTIHGDNKNKTITTNQANLNVIRNSNPNITMKSTISNISNQSKNSTVLNGVSEGNQLSFTLDVNDSNPESSMSNAVIGLKIPQTMEVTSVSLDKQNKPGTDISAVKDPDNPNGYILLINNIKFSDIKEHSIEVNGTVGKMGNMLSYTSMFILLGEDKNGNSLPSLDGEPLIWNLGNDLVSLKAHGWKYQTVNSTSKARLLRRMNITGNVLDIIDDRTDKKSAQLYLKQNQPFKSGSEILSAEIRYYRKDGGFTKLDGNGTMVEETTDGEALKSVAWSPEEGPLLYIYGGERTPGIYSTDLEWSLVQSIPNTNFSPVITNQA